MRLCLIIWEGLYQSVHYECLVNGMSMTSSFYSISQIFPYLFAMSKEVMIKEAIFIFFGRKYRTVTESFGAFGKRFGFTLPNLGRILPNLGHFLPNLGVTLLN